MKKEFEVTGYIEDGEELYDIQLLDSKHSFIVGRDEVKSTLIGVTLQQLLNLIATVTETEQEGK